MKSIYEDLSNAQLISQLRRRDCECKGKLYPKYIKKYPINTICSMGGFHFVLDYSEIQNGYKFYVLEQCPYEKPRTEFDKFLENTGIYYDYNIEHTDEVKNAIADTKNEIKRHLFWLYGPREKAMNIALAITRRLCRNPVYYNASKFQRICRSIYIGVVSIGDYISKDMFIDYLGIESVTREYLQVFCEFVCETRNKIICVSDCDIYEPLGKLNKFVKVYEL